MCNLALFPVFILALVFFYAVGAWAANYGKTPSVQNDLKSLNFLTWTLVTIISLPFSWPSAPIYNNEEEGDAERVKFIQWVVFVSYNGYRVRTCASLSIQLTMLSIGNDNILPPGCFFFFILPLLRSTNWPASAVKNVTKISKLRWFPLILRDMRVFVYLLLESRLLYLSHVYVCRLKGVKLNWADQD